MLSTEEDVNKRMSKNSSKEVAPFIVILERMLEP